MTRAACHLLAVAFSLYGVAGQACEPAPIDVDALAHSVGSISIGYVTGEHYLGYEQELARGSDPESVPLWGERLVRVFRTRALRGGGEQKVVEIVVPCGSAEPMVFSRVIVYSVRDKRWLLVPKQHESDVLEILGAGP